MRSGLIFRIVACCATLVASVLTRKLGYVLKCKSKIEVYILLYYRLISSQRFLRCPLVMSLVMDEHFLEDIEELVGVEIPMQLKKILYVNGYRNSKMIAQITDEDLEDIECFSRETLPKLLTDQNQHDEYFGIFANQVEQFKILNGHKKILKIISDHYKSMSSTQSSANIDNSDTNSSGCINTSTNTFSKRKGQESKATLKSLNKSVTQGIYFCAESNNLYRSIHNWIEAKCPEKKWSQIRERIKKIDIVPSCDQDNNILAYVTCYCSKIPVMVHKISKNKRFQKRWILSNFYRHFQIHFTEADEAKKIKKKQVANNQSSIKSFFTPSNNVLTNPRTIHSNKQVSEMDHSSAPSCSKIDVDKI